MTTIDNDLNPGYATQPARQIPLATFPFSEAPLYWEPACEPNLNPKRTQDEL